MRLFSLFLVITAILGYHVYEKAQEGQETVEVLSERVAALEAQQAEVLTALEANAKAMEEAEAEKRAETERTAKEQEGEPEELQANGLIYQDGTYEGEGSGFGGSIVVQVTLSGQQMTDIQIISASGEDQAYLSIAKGIIDTILSEQSTAVDTVTGATFSSTGILNAVEDALGKAEKK